MSGLSVMSRRAMCFWLLAGRTAEVQARLHHPFPGQTARAGAKGTGEEGSGGFGRAAVECCCQAEESPRWPGSLSKRYRATSHLSRTAHCSTAAAVAVCHITITHIQTQNTGRGGWFSASVCCFSRLRPIFLDLSCF